MRWFHVPCAADAHPHELHRELADYASPVADRDVLLARTAHAPPTRPFPRSEPWWEAVEAAGLERVRLLLDEGADVGARTNDRFSALHLAVLGGHAGVAELLLTQGADVRARGGIEHDTRGTPHELAVSA